MPSSEIVAGQSSSMGVKKRESIRLEKMGMRFFGVGIMTFAVGFIPAVASWGFIGGAATVVSSVLTTGVGLKYWGKQDKIDAEIRDTRIRLNPKNPIPPSPVAQISIMNKNSKNLLGSILESSEVESLAQSLTKLLGSVSARPLGAVAKYEVKRITEDSNALIGMVHELAEYDADAAKEQLVKGLQLLNRDAQKLVDDEKALITQRLESHNSYMEARSRA